MSKLIVAGRQKLSGATEIQGAKNSALPILAASLLAKGENVLYNCPVLSDVEASCRVLRYLGCTVSRTAHTLVIKTDGVTRGEIPEELMRKTRSSILFLGAMLAAGGSVRLSLPGGCEIGRRPIDWHLKGLRELGALITERHGRLECQAPYGLTGARISLSFPSVGATENLMIAASTANGTTTIINAAREPEITDLADYLNKCGAKIDGAGEGIVVIEGVKELRACSHTVIPDRIAAATLMSCAAVTGSRICIKNIIGSHLGAVIPVFEEAGCQIECRDGELCFAAPKRLKAFKTVRTMPYPGFPTDAQAPLLAAACTAKGTAVFVENIFENRYRHVSELARVGANIKTEGRVCVVEGVPALYGARVEATDLRGAAALVAAGLCAESVTTIGGVQYLERGYESLEQTLCSLGANVKKI